jgi:S-methylmethionine-dependent homocysteine/selenocysteine methylase
MDRYAARAGALPQLHGQPLVTDGGIETDLIFNRGIELREFAAFPMVEDEAGRRVLTTYFDEYAAIAADAGAGLLLESPTWRASSDWGERLGYSADDLKRVNATAITLLTELRGRYRPEIGYVVVSGLVGPRDVAGQRGGRADSSAAAEYHRPQIEVFAASGADMACAMTLDTCAEAIGITLASHDAGLPVAISFTVESDGRLPDGTPLGAAIATVDAAARPEYFMINCAHPSHIAPAFDRLDRAGEPDQPGAPGVWKDRILGVRYNASERSHAELDESPDIDRGDLEVLAGGHARLASHLPGLVILGGCCGTDATHVRHLWQAAQI